jgi:hypothetical protein
MARLWTSGGESGHIAAEGVTGGTNATISAVNPRSGSRHYRNSGASLTPVPTTYTLGRTYYARGYFSVPTFASGNVALWEFDTGGSAVAALLLPDRSIQVIIGGSTVFTSATGLVPADTYTRVEVKVLVASGNDTVELQVQGTSLYSTTTATIADVALSNVQFGAHSTGAVAVDTDDVALNDSVGTDQASWPGAGSVLILKPTADSARGTNWTGGAGGTASLFDAVDNTPPVGVVLASATNTSQIKNVAKDLVTVYDATLQTFTVGGVSSADTVSLVQPIAVIGGSNATMNLGIAGVSNPASAEVTGSVSGTIAGTFPTGWLMLGGTLVYAPSVTLGTAPVLRLRKNTNSTNAAMAALMGCVVEYVPATPSDPPVSRNRIRSGLIMRGRR